MLQHQNLPHVDLILLSRDLSPPREDVWEGIRVQRGVCLSVHRIVGEVFPGDPHRIASIARARNQARAIGEHPWVMFLDDDVVLDPDCVARLVEGLVRRPEFAAFAADCTKTMIGGWELPDSPAHVGMASVLFRRSSLDQITFRWEDDKCECRCCCDDLRASGWAIGYLEDALACHLPSDDDGVVEPSRTAPQPVNATIWIEPALERPETISRLPGQIFSAFDRRDEERFRTHFLASLRAYGNDEHVWAYAYGLYPSEIDRLRDYPNMTVIPIPYDTVCPALSRLRDFQDVVSQLPEETPVAYWDGGDVLFQAQLDPLWDLTIQYKDQLLAAEEPKSYPANPIIRPWCDCIEDPVCRDHAFRLMSSRIFLNSGFAAGTARAMLGYLIEGDHYLNSPALRGVGPWGDQCAMNLYCHTYPDRWRQIDRGWNYALAGRDLSEYTVEPDGYAYRHDGQPIYVLHGNAMMIRWLELSAWGPHARLGPTPPHAMLAGR